LRVCIVGDFSERSASYVSARQLEVFGVDVVRVMPGTPLVEALRQVRHADVVYGVARGFSWRFFASVKVLAKPVINHWIGTDVLRAISSSAWRLQARLTNFFVDNQLIVAPHLATELGSIGLQTGLVPIVPHLSSTNLRVSNPDIVSVLAYLPDSRPDFYGANIIYDLTREFPQISFYVVAGTSDVQPQLANIKYLGFVQNMDEIYEKAPVLIRITQHDGLPKMVLEALVRGNQVIYKNEFPYCYQASTYEETAICLAQIIAQDCPINDEGHRYVLKHYAPQAAIERLISALQG